MFLEFRSMFDFTAQFLASRAARHGTAHKPLFVSKNLQNFVWWAREGSNLRHRNYQLRILPLNYAPENSLSELKIVFIYSIKFALQTFNKIIFKSKTANAVNKKFRKLKHYKFNENLKLEIIILYFWSLIFLFCGAKKSLHNS